MSEPSPLQKAEAAKAARDLDAEMHALTTAEAELKAQPWYPLRPGDVVTLDFGDGQRETYHAFDDLEFNVDGTSLVCVPPDGATRPGHEPATGWRTNFFELWFEAGAAALTLKRGDQVLFDHGTTTAPANGTTP